MLRAVWVAPLHSFIVNKLVVSARRERDMCAECVCLAPPPHTLHFEQCTNAAMCIPYELI